MDNKSILYFSFFFILNSLNSVGSQEFNKISLHRKNDRVPIYHVIEIGTCGGASSMAYGINEFSQITGMAQKENGEWRAFLWEEGIMIELPLLPYFWNTYGYDINNYAEITGFAQIDDSLFLHAFLFSHGSIVDLGVIDGNVSTAFSLNNRSQIVGQADVYVPGSPPESNIVGRAFLYNHGEMIEIETLGGWSSRAQAINDYGSIVGGSEIGFEDHDGIRYEWHAFYRGYLNDTSIEIEPIDGPYNEAYSVNNKEVVVGDSTISLEDSESPNAYNIHGFLWKNNTTHDLSPLNGCFNSYARAVNDHNEVVGFSCSDERQHAVLWRRGIIHDLNSQLIRTQGWVLKEALDINNRGEIVGKGFYYGEERGFLLRPLSER